MEEDTLSTAISETRAWRIEEDAKPSPDAYCLWMGCKNKATRVVSSDYFGIAVCDEHPPESVLAWPKGRAPDL